MSSNCIQEITIQDQELEVVISTQDTVGNLADSPTLVIESVNQEVVLEIQNPGQDSVSIAGQIGPKGDSPAHQWNGTEIRFENPDGSWGPWVDIGGSGGGGIQVEKILEVDFSRPVAYVGYATRIKRMNYSSYPPFVDVYFTSNLNNDWPLRFSLIYEEDV